jgi:hypothetical protein
MICCIEYCMDEGGEKGVMGLPKGLSTMVKVLLNAAFKRTGHICRSKTLEMHL